MAWGLVLAPSGKSPHSGRAPSIRTDADGVGERSHLLKSHVNLDTHILDVVNEMRWQELNNIVLVGHSYAGMVISGVAEKMEKSIASVVMLDAFFPETGEALVDLQPPQVRDSFQAAERNGTLAIPPRRRQRSMSMERIARGSMRNARLILSNAFYRS